ncbi:MAG: histidinol-phosphatase HisJ family protein [Candidatus Eisenbacteria bacterium]
MTVRSPFACARGQVLRVRRGLKRRWLGWTRQTRELEPARFRNLVDYHIHTKLCGHAIGEPIDYVREAVKRGLTEIGFADHMPLLRISDEHLTMGPHQLPQYVSLIEELRGAAGGITVRLGIEMDYFPGQMDEIWAAAADIDFDYVYGSVHYIDGWGFDDSRRLSSYQGRDPDEVYVEYFALFCEAAREGGFDIMAHPDLVKKHGIVSRVPIDHLYEAAALALSEAGVAIEVNTSGLRVRAVEPYPSLSFLKLCARHGVAVTLGSDAHAPRQVGMDFDIAVRMLEKAGIKEIATFERRKRSVRGI